MEKKLFLTVANYSLPENSEKYLECLRNTPETPTPYYNYTKWLYPGFRFKLGLAKFPKGSAWETLYKLKAISGEDDRFTKTELKTFEQQRKNLISVLDQMVNGKPLEDINELRGLLLKANQLTLEDEFNVGSNQITKGQATLYPWIPKEKRRSTPNLLKKNRVLLFYDILNPVFNLACYGLNAFLADIKHGERGLIKHCARCNKFFLRNRKDERNKFCSDDCRNLHNREQRKTDEGKKRRAEYMKKRRANWHTIKQEREQSKNLKRFMDNLGCTRKEAEKLLNEDDA